MYTVTVIETKMLIVISIGIGMLIVNLDVYLIKSIIVII